MKIRLLVFLLFCTSICFSQIVNIPDPNFKAFLLNHGDRISFQVDTPLNQQILDLNGDNEIQVSEALNVTSMIADYRQINSFEGIEAFANLQSLICSNNNATSLNIGNLVNLLHLEFAYNNISSINTTNLSLLERLDISSNPITSVNLNGNPLLNTLYANGTLLTSIDISHNSQLEEVSLKTPTLSSVNFGNIRSIHTLYCDNSQITTIDLSKLTFISYFSCSNMQQLQFANLKTGNYQVVLSDLTGINPQAYFCVDENNLSYYQNLFQGYPSVQIGTYCTFTPGGNYNTITGTFTFDGDNNGCSLSDSVAQNIRIGLSGGTQAGIAITNASGNYSFYTQDGNYTLTPQVENNWFTATPATANVNFANNNNNTSTQNFCIAPNGVHPDVEVVLVPEGSAQPGFDARYKIVFKNKGNQTLSGNVLLTYNEALLDLVPMFSTVPTSAVSGQLTWAYSNLLPFESRVINVTLNLNGPMETPPVNLDDVLNYTVSISPTTGDETPADNTFALNQIVTGSYDPNDITCLEGDSVHPSKIGDYLHYNINFENTGNAPATFIVVKDMINAQQYDINTLQMLYASHSAETRINGNKVEFFFDDINLGPLAKGNVVFKIKTQPNVALNSAVMNKAEIFFDYNWPIVTNEAETTFAVLSSGDFAVDNSVSIYPNPAITNVNIKASAEITSLQLYDVQGRLLQAVPVSGNEAVLDVSGRTSGIYFVKVMTDKGIKVEKLIRK